jgi:hypothetical protein
MLRGFLFPRSKPDCTACKTMEGQTAPKKHFVHNTSCARNLDGYRLQLSQDHTGTEIHKRQSTIDMQPSSGWAIKLSIIQNIKNADLIHV